MTEIAGTTAIATPSEITEVVVVDGEGCFLTDIAGRRYLDFTSGTGVTNTGHCHPRVVAAIRRQAARLLHAQAQGVEHGGLSPLVEALRRHLPPELPTVLFTTSGAEAVELSVLIARRATGRANVVVFEGGFHGRTIGAMSLSTAEPRYRAGCQPLMAGVHVAPYPDSYRYGWSPETTVSWCLDTLGRLFETQTAPEDTAAILVEPVLGEGGIVVPPAPFLPALRQFCDVHGLLLLVDEVLSGFGRTGWFFAIEQAGITPDALIVAKGIASGLPLGAVAVKANAAAQWTNEGAGSTFRASPLACAAALATVETIEDEQLVARAAERGQRLLEELRRLQRRYDIIGDVRGAGLLVGVEFRGMGPKRARELAADVRRACLDDRLLLMPCGIQDQVLAWLPPLIVGEGEIEAALSIFTSAVERVAVASAKR